MLKLILRIQVNLHKKKHKLQFTNLAIYCNNPWKINYFPAILHQAPMTISLEEGLVPNFEILEHKFWIHRYIYSCDAI